MTKFSLNFTGERMMPEFADKNTFWDHVYRYRFAATFVKGKKVLDVASGEGYGVAALGVAGAKQVVGIEIDSASCRNAKHKHRLDVCQANAEELPIADRTIDVVVSFETIEHLNCPRKLVAECHRVLNTKGLLILSTPNREVYSEGGKHNPFHTVEFNREELTALVREHFKHFNLFSQRSLTVSRWSLLSLAADRTEWVNTRGFWRVRNILREATCPHLWRGDVDEVTRSKPIPTILASGHPLESLVNPYQVRKWSPQSVEKPFFYIVVASKA